MTTLIPEPKGATISCPDPERVQTAAETQRKLHTNLRIYCNAQDRVAAGFKRLSADLKQVNNTVTMIRESFKTLQTMEGLLNKEFKMDTAAFAELYDKMDTMFSQWKANIDK